MQFIKSVRIILENSFNIRECADEAPSDLQPSLAEEDSLIQPRSIKVGNAAPAVDGAA